LREVGLSLSVDGWARAVLAPLPLLPPSEATCKEVCDAVPDRRR